MVDLCSVLRRYRQFHILEHIEGLSSKKRQEFLKNLEGLDISLPFSAFERKVDGSLDRGPIFPPSAVQRANDVDSDARRMGEEALRENKVAILLVAGGQGTRLGFTGPKGLYPITPVKQKPFFQLFSESVLAISQIYNCSPPFLIMTSSDTHDETVRFFEQKGFFGLKGPVFFLKQCSLPVVTPEGELVLTDEAHIATSPDGHGGALKALKEYGLFEYLLGRGFEYLFYFQVDNPLVRIADPIFLGHHILQEAQVSTKVVRRRHMNEKVGLYVRTEKGDLIVEYTEKDERFSTLDANGNPLFWAGNTAIHVFSLSFLKEIVDSGVELPLHLVERSMEVFDENGGKTTRRVIKFERFIFDVIPFAERTCVVEIAREEEFSPVKNASGEDSPEEARRAMVSFYKRRLKEVGVDIEEQVTVEIEPFLLLDPEALKRCLEHVRIGRSLYIARP